MKDQGGELARILDYDEYRFDIKYNHLNNKSSIREELIQVIGKPFFSKLDILDKVPSELKQVLKDNHSKEKILILCA